jgi:hypothetical protein
MSYFGAVTMQRLFRKGILMYWSFVSGWHEHASAITAPNLRLACCWTLKLNKKEAPQPMQESENNRSHEK